MSTENNNDKLLDNIRSELDQSVDGLDAATHSRITQARHRALDGPASRIRPGKLAPLGAALAVCVLVAVVSLAPESRLEPTPSLNDLELLSNVEDLELLEELEFYEWLEEYELPT